MTRKTKTPAQRAAERLAAARRAQERVERRANTLEYQFAAATDDLKAANLRLSHCMADPDLPQEPEK